MKHIAKFVVIFILLLTLKATDSGWDTVPIANAAFDCADPGIECHSGTISSNETWTASQVHFVDDVLTIAQNATLTIEDDVIIKMITIGNDNNEIIVAGTLNINDSGGQPVYITSSRDDTTPDGDTNGDGSDSTPYDGIWRSITFQSGSSGTFNNVEIRFAGDDTRGAIHVEDSNHTLQLNNLTVKNSDWAAISALANHNITVNGFTANSTPIGGLEIRNTALTGNTTWDQTGIVHIISDDFTVASGGKLTIDPGIVVKFASGKSLLVDGELDVNGTANNNVYFTSLRDDTLPAGNGDTNGDGGNTTPAPGNWKSIYFRNGSDGSIDHAQIRYGGSGSNTGAVQVASVSPSISNSTLRNNKIALYSTGSGATPEVNNSDFFTIASLLLWQAALAKF
ncbi:MAG: hypothetical protein H6633_14735 [Anaerolineales bacterium]|nr:hypothetical protein [Anaerolineales bacterium]